MSKKNKNKTKKDKPAPKGVHAVRTVPSHLRYGDVRAMHTWNRETFGPNE